MPTEWEARATETSSSVLGLGITLSLYSGCGTSQFPELPLLGSSIVPESHLPNLLPAPSDRLSHMVQERSCAPARSTCQTHIGQLPHETTACRPVPCHLDPVFYPSGSQFSIGLASFLAIGV